MAWPSAVDRNNNVVRYTYYTASTPYVKFGERFI
jgi:hypothetical protein